MKKKLFALTAVLGISAFVSSVPRAEAVGYCSSTYCAGKPLSTSCGCPPGTDKVGKASTCGGWNKVSATGCWYG